jgi:mono/diheme cytochrome c family protein
VKLLRSIFNLVLATVGAVVVVVALYVARTWDRTYDIPLPALKASSDSAVVQRGEYLVHGPAHCVECHVSSPAEARSAGEGAHLPLKGGIPFPLGPLGVVYSRNLTPDLETGIGRYTDGQIARMMRWAVRPDGRASIAPMMPFGDMSDQDLVAIISYLRAQPAVRNEVPPNEWTLFGKVLKSFVPTALPRRSIHPAPFAPAQEPTRERGEYLARFVGNCIGCHTPRSGLTYIPIGPEFAGGMEIEPVRIPSADQHVFFRSPNLTPWKGSALLKFPDRETFVARFKRGGRQHEGSPMPWEAFARMSEADLGALFEFLRSLPPAAGPTGDPAFRKSN